MHNNALLEKLHQQDIRTRERKFIKKLIINVAQIAFNLKLKKKSLCVTLKKEEKLYQQELSNKCLLLFNKKALL